MDSFRFDEKYLSQIPGLQVLVNWGYRYLPPAEALKTQKCGLMQKLLTGRWRLSVADAPSPPTPLPRAGEGSKTQADFDASQEEGSKGGAAGGFSPLPRAGEGGRRPGEGQHD